MPVFRFETNRFCTRPLSRRRPEMSKKTQLPFHPKNYLMVLTEFQKTACRFRSKILIKKGDTVADAKSFIEIVSLLGVHGNTVEISAHGADALEALKALEYFGGPDLFKNSDYLPQKAHETAEEADPFRPLEGEI